MSQKEESLEEKIARIRKQNAAIIERQKMIQEEIKHAEKNNAVVNLKTPVADEDFGPTLYSDELSREKKTSTCVQNDSWEEKVNIRRNFHQNDMKEEKWREERKRIDEERIRRQKINTGSWKREWDADKIVQSDSPEDGISKNTANSANKSYKNGNQQSRKNYNETKENMLNDNAPQNRWKSNPPSHRYSSERRTNGYDRISNRVNLRNVHSFETDSRRNLWRKHSSETDEFNNNDEKSDPKNRTISTEIFRPVENSKTENWAVNVKTETVKPQVNQWTPSFTETRPIAVRGNKWNHSSENEMSNQPASNLHNRPIRYNRPLTGMNLRKLDAREDTELYNDSSKSKINPDDLKNIVIRVNNSGKKLEREVIVDDTKKNLVSNTLENHNIDSNSRSFENAPCGTMTFERSDLKHVAEPVRNDLPSEISIVTQMFSNSKIVDPNLPSNTNLVWNNSSQYCEDSQQPSDVNFAEEYLRSLGIENNSNSKDVQIIRTINKDNIAVTAPSNTAQNSKKSESLDLKNHEVSKEKETMLESNSGDDEWEDVSDDGEWEDVSEEEEEIL